MKKQEIVAIAAICHNANADYCLSLGDNSQSRWEYAEQWQKDSAIKGVIFHHQHPDAPPEATHESWREQKVKDGWTYGAVKDPENKRHPCITPFEDLPGSVQAKDRLFAAIVRALTQ